MFKVFSHISRLPRPKLQCYSIVNIMNFRRWAGVDTEENCGKVFTPINHGGPTRMRAFIFHCFFIYRRSRESIEFSICYGTKHDRKKRKRREQNKFGLQTSLADLQCQTCDSYPRVRSHPACKLLWNTKNYVFSSDIKRFRNKIYELSEINVVLERFLFLFYASFHPFFPSIALHVILLIQFS